MIEIERKYLVRSDAYRNEAKAQKAMEQGFLNTHPDRTVRVRIMGDKGFLTVKGRSNSSGTTRFEWEREIPLQEAKALLLLCEEGVIQKIRFYVPKGKHVFEVDEFQGANKGLTVAEVELQSETEAFEVPEWLGAEVTGDVRYYNSHLSKQPFATW
ncbi:CYTH domain-containing protein [Maribacter sp. 2-571]|uniref:CYTH domain-containing protein n=1 Tax=Maribacter sp. 2-571 TaxID=3417569 RepID=UPI003D3516E5